MNMEPDLIPRAAPAAPPPRPPAGPAAAVPFTPGGLRGPNTPPFLLPAEHFTAALLFWVAGAAGVVWVAPDLVQGAFPLPRVVAVAHLFTLGWITTSIMGALYQFLPVALGEPIRSERLAHLTFALYAPGLLLFVGGLAGGRQEVMLPGAALFGTGLLLFVGNLGATLHRCRERTLTWWALVPANFFLLATVVLGISLAGNLRWNWLGGHRMVALGVHLHVAIAGWVLLVMVGVAHRLLPMFLLSHRAPEAPGKVAVGLLTAGTAVLLAFHHFLTPLVRWSVAALLAGGLLAFLVQAVLFFRHRKKPGLDPGLRLAALALAFLAAALGMAPGYVTRGLSAPGPATAYVVALLGGISLFVAGHHYKIVPFLVWFHRYGPWIGKRPVPTVAELYARPGATLAALLLAAGLGGLLAAILAGRPEWARPAAASFAAGAVVVAIQMAHVLTRRPA
jgi:hypothetical protein